MGIGGMGQARFFGRFGTWHRAQPVVTSRVQITDLRTPCPRRQAAASSATSTHAGGGRSARASGLRPHAKTHKSPELARLQIDARRGRHLLRQARRGGSVRRRRHRGHPAALPAQSRQRRSRARACSTRPRCRSSSTTSTSRAAGRRRCSAAGRERRRARQGGRRLPSLRHRSGLTEGAPELVARVAELPGLRFRGLPQPRRPRLRRRIRERDGGDCRRRSADAAALADRRPSARASRRGDQRRRHADRALQPASSRASPSCGRATTSSYDRTQVALGAATLDDCALTVLARVVSTPAADRSSSTAGSKTLSTDQARGFRNAPGFGVVFARSACAGARRVAARRAALGRARDRARAQRPDAARAPAISCASCRITPASSRTSWTRVAGRRRSCRRDGAVERDRAGSPIARITDQR